MPDPETPAESDEATGSESTVCVKSISIALDMGMANFAVFVIQIRQAEGSQGLAPLDVQAALSVFIGRRLHAGVVAEDVLPADRYQRFLAGRVAGIDMTWLSTGRPVRLISIRADGGA